MVEERTEPPPQEERRQFDRVPARVEIRFEQSAQAARALRAYSMNFAVGGICLKTRRAYSVGDSLQVDMRIGKLHLKLAGCVAWSRPGGIGVRFEELSDADRARLTELLQSLKR